MYIIVILLVLVMILRLHLLDAIKNTKGDMILSKEYKVHGTSNKYIDLAIAKSPQNNKIYFNVEFLISRKCDHPGVRISISIFKATIDVHFYDNRHWDEICTM